MTIRQRFDAIDLLLLKAWVQDRQQEDLHLDFKTVIGEGLNRDDRKNLAKAISGFANSEGGIVVWGMDSRKDESGIDAASELKPLANVQAAFSQLQFHTGDSTSPIVDGVEHRLIDTGDGTGLIGQERDDEVTMRGKDPIIEKIHTIREEIAREAGYDIEKIIEMARARQEASGLKAVRLPARKVEPANLRQRSAMGQCRSATFADTTVGWTANSKCRAPVRSAPQDSP